MITNTITSPVFARHGAVRFQGIKATQLAQGNLLLEDDQLKVALRQEKDPYYGAVPTPLWQWFGVSVKDTRKLLDELAGILKGAPLKNKTPVKFGLPNGNDVVLKLAGHGEDGHAYQLMAGDATYAFKVLNRDGNPFEEVANAAYLNARQTKDAATLHLANPFKSWLLMEFIGPNTRLAGRPGRTMEQQGFETNDDFYEPNRINGILVDFGGELCVPRGYMDWGTFEQKLRQLGLMR